MKYGGSAMMGLSQGLQTGLDWGMKMNQIKYEVAQKKKLDDEQEALNQTWADFGQNMSKLYDSGTLSDLDMKEMTMITLQLPQTLQQQAMQTMNFLKQGQKEEYEKSLKDFEMTLEFIKQTGAQGDYTSLKKLLDEDQIKIIDAVLDTYKSLPEQSQMEVYSSVEALRQVHGENAPFEWNSNAGGYVPKYETGTLLSQKDQMAIDWFKNKKITFNQLLDYWGIGNNNEKPTALQEKIGYLNSLQQSGLIDEQQKQQGLIKLGGIDIGENGTDTGKPPAYGTFQNIEQDLTANVETKEDYNREIARLKQLNIDTSAFSYPGIIKNKYNSAMEWAQYAESMLSTGQTTDESGTDLSLMYQNAISNAHKYNEEYYNETGQHLSQNIGNQEVEKIAKENITMTLVNEMIKNGRTFKDYDLEELKRMGVDVEEAKEMLIKKMQGGVLW